MTSQTEPHTYREILTQPETWRATLRALQPRADDVQAWASQGHDGATFIGCGSTYYLSLSTSRVWQALMREQVQTLPSSEAWLFPELLTTGGSPLMLAHSRSGETTETLRALDAYRQRSPLRPLVVTCKPDSQITDSDPFVVTAEQADEKSVAQTRSFTGMLLASQAVAALAAANTEHLSQLSNLPDHLEALLPDYLQLAERLGGDEQLDHFVFLGSGVNHGLACEAMLKMKEMSQSRSEAFHFLEYRHGPKATMTTSTLIVGLVSDQAKTEELRLIREAKSAGAHTLCIGSPGSDSLDLFDVSLPESLSDLSRGLLALPLLQLLAYHRAMARGLNPDRPANLDPAVLL
ncbi:MAG: SIS domain-containing protein [Anaerolineales bacterium]|jgi:glucosamine--fructose-6-phosphate aminotransferase (isomerizing)